MIDCYTLHEQSVEIVQYLRTGEVVQKRVVNVFHDGGKYWGVGKQGVQDL